MKKKLLLLFSLFLLILPISGCGEDEGDAPKPKYDVKISLAKNGTDATADSNFLLNDCAMATGSGTYTEGDKVDIIIKYVKKACKFSSLDINTTQSLNLTPTSIDDVFDEVKYSIHSITEVKDIRVVFTGINTTVKETRIYFEGLNKKYTDVGTGTSKIAKVSKDNYAIPYLEKQSTPSASVEAKEYGGLAGNMSLASILGNTKALNLNYVYLKEGNDFIFQPYKLIWRVGTYTLGGADYCSYPDSSLMSGNPNEFIVESGDSLCLSATLDLTQEPANMELLKENAINNLVSGEVYISTNSDVNDACRKASDASVNISEDCMYVGRMKNLYKIENKSQYGDSDAVAYAAVTKAGLLEEIKTTTMYAHEYYICSNSSLNECKGNSKFVNKISYPRNDFSLLRINDFIKALKYDSTIKKEKISIEDVVFDYDPIIKDIVIGRIIDGTTTYYINYIGDSTKRVQYSGELQMNARNINLITSNLYSLTFNKTAVESIDVAKLDTLEKTINANNANLMYNTTHNAEKIQSEFKSKIYNIINNDSNLKSLKNYIYEVSVSGKVITVTPNKILLENSVVTEYINIKFGSRPDENKTCYVESLDCMALNEQKLLKYIKNNLLKTSTEKLENFQIIDISKNSGDITFKFKDDGEDIVIIYNTSTKEFRMDTITLKYVTAEDVTVNKMTITLSINSSMLESVLTQKYSGPSSNVVTTVDNVPLEEDVVLLLKINTVRIQEIYNLLMGTVNGKEGQSGIISVGTGANKLYFFFDETKQAVGRKIYELKLQNGSYQLEYEGEKFILDIEF